jgi:GT2 family glycosyltransferase
MNDLPSVSIIISTYNGKKILDTCLSSLFQKTDYPRERMRVVVVDDGSIDGTCDFVQQKYLGEVSIIRLEENLGFIRANNKAIQHCLEDGSDYVLLLNNDTRFIQNDWLKKLIETSESCGLVAAISPTLVFPNRQIQWSGRPREDRTFFLILQTITCRNNPGFGIDSSNKCAEDVQEVDTATGACMLMKSDVIRAIGMFDTTLSPAYQEDVEYSFRAWRAGFKVLYRPDSFVIHEERLSHDSPDSEASRKKKYWQLRNCMIVSFRYFGLAKALVFGAPIYIVTALFDVRDKHKGLTVSNLRLASGLGGALRVLHRSTVDALTVYLTEPS